MPKTKKKVVALAALDTEATHLGLGGRLLTLGFAPSDLQGNAVEGVPELDIAVYYPRRLALPLEDLEAHLSPQDIKALTEEADLSLEGAYLSAPPEVREMHAHNGIWERCGDPEQAFPLATVEEELLKRLAMLGKEGTVGLLAATPSWTRSFSSGSCPSATSGCTTSRWTLPASLTPWTGPAAPSAFLRRGTTPPWGTPWQPGRPIARAWPPSAAFALEYAVESLVATNPALAPLLQDLQRVAETLSTPESLERLHGRYRYSL